MTKRILIDATHAEETRVVLLDGNKVEDFDVETAAKRQLKGNIYLAKVVRVEPSLQAAFVEYGGGRHGFLAFGEIHPDYYQIPVADREKLLALQAQAAREDEEMLAMAPGEAIHAPVPDAVEVPESEEDSAPAAEAGPAPSNWGVEAASVAAADKPIAPFEDEAPPPDASPLEPTPIEAADAEAAADAPDASAFDEGADDDAELEAPPPETLEGAGDTFEGNGADEARLRARRAASFLRNYRIQEVIKRRQILLVQVVKEERGNKGAALTTYISLAGRFCVLMPNSPRGGGISRKITSAADRRRLKEITTELQIPDGMGLIVRTAGANRPKPEIVRDCEYLMRLWDDIRELTLRSTAPALIYEEANLIKRTIRDLYSRDIEDVVVEGEAGWTAAHEFMRMLMPAHAKKVVLWQGSTPLFAHHHVEAQLDAMLSPSVALRSGGSLVINQAEALVAIDVNSGRATRERGIEETALKTNLEAADEVARQLRLRDLAGLIVIDFIDMENRRHNHAVERRLKDALKSDRARIQVGSISHFGLMEMSRQRLRPSLAESSFVACPHCGGTGHVRGTESSAIHVLRAIEEEAAKGRANAIVVHVAPEIALYMLNHKRARLAEIEARHAIAVSFAADASLVAPAVRIERTRTRTEAAPAPIAAQPHEAPEDAAEDATEDAPDAEEVESGPEDRAEASAAGDNGDGRRRRRRRRRGGRREDEAAPVAEADRAPEGSEAAAVDAAAPLDPAHAEQPELPGAEQGAGDEETPRARRRGRRGGRRRRRDAPLGVEQAAESSALEAEAPDDEALPPEPSPPPAPAYRPAYVGPTPADPFAGQALDIFDLMERAEEAQLATPPARPRAGEVTLGQVAGEPSAPSPAMGEGEVEAAAPAEPTGLEVPKPAPVAANEAVPTAPPAVDVDAEPLAPEARKRGWWRR